MAQRISCGTLGMKIKPHYDVFIQHISRVKITRGLFGSVSVKVDTNLSLSPDVIGSDYVLSDARLEN